MQIRNKVLVTFFLEEGCKQKDGEVYSSWQPINFAVYSGLFQELIQEASDEWLSENTIDVNCSHEVIFAHCVEHDGAGAVTSEYFEPICHEHQNW
ncbi:hypothetical protein [Neptunomonas sp. XY-337]|uniref:hypothetical protein n=1 Tax=Neptunomonas sp. XY-337 TaxID=2561897 RepID=UPI0010A9F805|nr:hypothetical protein [Neptunomonas sp. XY-337]